MESGAIGTDARGPCKFLFQTRRATSLCSQRAIPQRHLCAVVLLRDFLYSTEEIEGVDC
jgi:hypothetical protein